MPYLKLTTNTPLNNLEKPGLLKQLSQFNCDRNRKTRKLCINWT